MTTTKRRRRAVLALLLAIAAAIAAYGYTATNTVEGSRAGDGSGAIAGYDVSSVSYTLLSSDPTKISGVSFTLDNAASGAAAQVQPATGWANCTITDGTSAACTFASGSEPDVAPASNLRVVAVS